jgi:signal transduction histidine kinase
VSLPAAARRPGRGRARKTVEALGDPAEAPIPADPPPPRGVRGALWRALGVFRWVSLGYAVIAASFRLGHADRPGLGLAVVAVMVVWTAVMTVLGPAADRRWPRLLQVAVAADVAMCVLVVLATELVGPRPNHALPMVWAASGVLSAALIWGTVGGLVGGLLVAGAFFVEWGTLSQALGRTTVQELVAGAVAGYLCRAASRAEAALADLRAARAADAQRARLAREVHDGVLQVLALIARQAPRGMPAGQIARLAAEQEATLRDLLRSPGPTAGPALAATIGAGGNPADDLGAALVRLAHPPTGGQEGAAPAALPPLTVATPGVPVLLPAPVVAELVNAVRAALDNVARHAGLGAAAWVLLEDEEDAVVVTVRDNGVGLAAGRAEQAAAGGRLGLADSIHGRVRDLGGEVSVLSRPGQGTEVELRVPR